MPCSSYPRGFYLAFSTQQACITNEIITMTDTLDSSPSWHACLRQHTAAAHQALEHAAPLRRLVAADLSRVEYGGLLARFWGFLAPLEPLLRERLAHSTWLVFVDPALRLDGLHADLHLLGIDPAGLPVAKGDWLAADPAAAVGVLYVLLGSTLGGQVIIRALGKSLGLSAASGAAYHAAEAARAERAWPRFLATLDATPWNTSAARTLQTAAVATFQHFQDWLE